MTCQCPSCASSLIKKNGMIHNGKQNHRCLQCGRQFVLDPEQKQISDETKALIRKTLLERISLEGVCRVFDVSMPWLLGFINHIVKELPEDLHAEVLVNDEETEVILLEADELWSYVGSKEHPAWLWMVMHSKTRQVLSMEIGPRNRATADALFSKLSPEIKKKPSTEQIFSQCTMTLCHNYNIKPLVKVQEKLLTLKDLIARSDNDAQDW